LNRGRKIGVLTGIYQLQTIFEEKYYDNLPGGLLEAFGRGFGHNMKLMVYPANDVETGELYDYERFKAPKNLVGLHQYMVDNNKMEGIQGYNEKYLNIHSDDVLAKIRAGATSWEEDVPEAVAKAIKFYSLFGYHVPETVS